MFLSLFSAIFTPVLWSHMNHGVLIYLMLYLCISHTGTVIKMRDPRHRTWLTAEFPGRSVMLHPLTYVFCSEWIQVVYINYGNSCYQKDNRLPKGPCKYKKNIKIQKKFGYDTPHPPTPLSKKKKFRKISKVCNQEYLYIEARTKA